jgi:hypothetical protein
MVDANSRDWSSKDRVGWWLRTVGMAIPIGAVAAGFVAWLLINGLDLQTKTAATQEHKAIEAELKTEMEEAMEPVRDDMKWMRSRIDAIHDRLMNGRRR